MAWQDFLPGAILVGVGVEALHVFTVVWISRSFQSKSEAFGAIGGSLSILLWSYVMGRILAAAPVLNAAAWRRTHVEPIPAPLPPPSLEPSRHRTATATSASAADTGPDAHQT